MKSRLLTDGPPSAGASEAAQRVRYLSADGASVTPCPRTARSGTIPPPFASGAPSRTMCSMRTWSWNHSTCRRFVTAAATGPCSAGAQCAEICRLCAAATAAIRSHSVYPPQRVASACRQSTALGVGERPGVLAGGHVGRDPAAHVPQPVEVVRAHRFLEPGHAEVVEAAPHPHRLADRVAPVGVDEQLDVVPDGLAGEPHPGEV